MIKKIIRWLMKRLRKRKPMAQKTTNVENNIVEKDLNTIDIETVIDTTDVETEYAFTPETIAAFEEVEHGELESFPTVEAFMESLVVDTTDLAKPQDGGTGLSLDNFEIVGISNNPELTTSVKISDFTFTTDAKTLMRIARHIETTFTKLGFKSTNHKV